MKLTTEIEGGIKRHPFNVFPEAGEEDFARLVEDIQTNGYDASMPVTVYQGAILDGWNRYKACIQLGVEPATDVFSGTDTDAIRYALRTNKRRNITSSQWAYVAVEADEVFESIRAATEKERREKQAQSQQEKYQPGEPGKTLSGNLLPDSPKDEAVEKKDDDATKTATKVAQEFNTNRTYYKQAKKLKEENPEAYSKVGTGEQTISKVVKAQKIYARREELNKQAEEIHNNSELNVPDGLFDVIAIDPPWNYGREYDPQTSRVANPYPEMCQSDLKEIYLPAKQDAVLFIWTTHQFLFDAKELLDHWGFDYKATMVWDKEKMGMGAWLRMQCEFCLVGIKGKPFWDNTKHRDIIREPRREHSRKPDLFFSIAENVTAGRRLEYFSRQTRNGWEVFGNDVDRF